jgi:hypothetical protein
MRDAFIIETRDRAAGVAVRDRSGFRFFASETPFYALDQRTFRHLRALHSAVEAIADSITKPGVAKPGRA